jgi:hypothetical protein
MEWAGGTRQQNFTNQKNVLICDTSLLPASSSAQRLEVAAHSSLA